MDTNQIWKVAVKLPHHDPRVLKLLRYPLLMEEGKVKLLLRCSINGEQWHYGKVAGEFAEFSFTHEPTPEEQSELALLENPVEQHLLPLYAFNIAEEIVSLRDGWLKEMAEIRDELKRIEGLPESGLGPAVLLDPRD